MKKIALIIKREYLTRVKKRSFIIMTILGPILMAALMIVPIYIARMSDGEKIIAVIDETLPNRPGIFFERLPDSESIKFNYIDTPLEKAKNELAGTGFYAILYIQNSEYNLPTSAILYSEKQPSLVVKSYIADAMKREIESLKLSASGIDEEVLQSIKTNVSITTIKIKAGGEEEKGYSEISMALGLFSGILIYFFIFMFGTQVMRGVIEEKTSRIIEVIISSVKPFQLMMGKIIGVAMVGLTQFLLWVVLTFALVTIFQAAMPGKLNFSKPGVEFREPSKMLSQQELTLEKQAQLEKQSEVNQVMEAIGSIKFGTMIVSFLFYFLFGYLLYAALFAAIGSAVDNESDTQQFMLPITIPLIFSILMSQFVTNNPEGPVSFWLSIIPLTSPVIMMIRIPYGVPLPDVLLSVGLLVAGFIAATWFAGKIYRTGILMYGKKASYKELFKWLTYRG